MLLLHTNTLMDSVSQLLEIKSDILQPMVNEICEADIPFEAVYADFHSGGWHTALLYATDEGNTDGTLRDGIANPTQLAHHLPLTCHFLDSLGLEYFAVRIARNDPDSWMWEHRDYVELEEGKNRLRLHIPLVTSLSSLIQFSPCAVHMATGWIWKLDPTINHAISNTGINPRTHLILDCYKNVALQRMLESETIQADHVHLLPSLEPRGRVERLIQADEIFIRGGRDKAELHLLKSFHQFNLGAETSYDLLINFYRDMGFRSRENYWIAEQVERVYKREKINPIATVGSLRGGKLFPNPHAVTSDLPQYKLVDKILRTCRQCTGLEQAYIRGSLARGDVDHQSDIDLMCVVAPEDFSKFIREVDLAIKEKYNTLAERWVDTIVKDFGGVGFVYLLEVETVLYELDLYVACRGHPSLSYLINRVPHRQEIFRQNDKDEGIPGQNELYYRLHEDSVQEHIQNIKNGDHSVSSSLTELCILGFMIKKCIDRKDEFVASSEFNMWKRCFIKLVRSKFDREHRDYGFYHLKRLLSECNDGGTLYEDLRAINNHPLTKENFMIMHRYAMGVAQKHFPQEYEQERKLIQLVTRHITGHKFETLASQLTPWKENTLDFKHSG